MIPEVVMLGIAPYLVTVGSTCAMYHAYRKYFSALPKPTLRDYLPQLLSAIHQDTKVFNFLGKRHKTQYDGPMPESVVIQQREENLKIVKTLCFVVIGYSISYIPFLAYIAQRLFSNGKLKSFSLMKNLQVYRKTPAMA